VHAESRPTIDCCTGTAAALSFWFSNFPAAKREHILSFFFPLPSTNRKRGRVLGWPWQAPQRSTGRPRQLQQETVTMVRGSIPLFNLGRQDMPWVVLLCVFCASVALIVRSGQGDHPQGRHAWKDLLVIIGTLGALVMCVLALVKLVISYCHEPLNGMLFKGYEKLEQGGGVPVKTQEVKPQMAAASAREIEPRDSRPVSVAAPTGRSSYRASYTPREEEDIECGLLLEASAVDFEYNGVRHQKGSLRVIKVERDGVCEVSFCDVPAYLCLCVTSFLLFSPLS
jgi:hypothetical protein